MVWKPEVDEIKFRRQLAEQMGGPESIAKHHKRGKLTVRERIAAFVDPGSFQEIGGLAGSATYDGDKLVDVTPSNYVIGLCDLDGRRVVFSAGDFTVRGGASDASVGNKTYWYIEDLALRWKLPYIRLLDATGGSARSYEQLGRTYVPNWPGTKVPSQLLCTTPVVSAVLGSIAGGPAVDACLSHFNLMVKGISQLFAGGPPVVKAATGVDISKEDLGDERTQVFESGVIDNLVDSEEEAFRTIKRFLSYMPSNVWEMPPYVKPTDSPDRRDEELLSIIPREKRKPYNPHKILEHVLDRDSFFEIAPFYGRSRVIGLARVNGYPVGVMINNSYHLGGSMDLAAGDKVYRFLQMCDTFHLPMVYFCDEPGFMVGLEAQKQGILRAGARMVCTTIDTKMPWITFIIRQAFGVAGSLHYRPDGMFARYAWPSGSWGSIHIEGGTTAAYRQEIMAADDPEAKRLEIEQRLKTLASPFRTAEAFNIDDIIDPRDTRRLLCDFIGLAQTEIKTQLGPSFGPSYRP